MRMLNGLEKKIVIGAAILAALVSAPMVANISATSPEQKLTQREVFVKHTEGHVINCRSLDIFSPDGLTVLENVRRCSLDNGQIWDIHDNERMTRVVVKDVASDTAFSWDSL
jgi:hypothetical protein